MALRSSRRGTDDGRPPGFTGGTNGRIRSHCASVRSLGYVGRSNEHDGQAFEDRCMVDAFQSAMTLRHYECEWNRYSHYSTQTSFSYRLSGLGLGLRGGATRRTENRCLSDIEFQGG